MKQGLVKPQRIFIWQQAIEWLRLSWSSLCNGSVLYPVQRMGVAMTTVLVLGWNSRFDDSKVIWISCTIFSLYLVGDRSLLSFPSTLTVLIFGPTESSAKWCQLQRPNLLLLWAGPKHLHPCRHRYQLPFMSPLLQLLLLLHRLLSRQSWSHLPLQLSQQQEAPKLRLGALWPRPSVLTW